MGICYNNEFRKVDKDIYIVPILKCNSYLEDNIINKNIKYLDLICPICYNILNEPKCCSSKKNCHYFCKKCIDEYLKNKDNCPICKNKFQYIENKEIFKLLNNLLFKCIFHKEGCRIISNYLDYFNHIKKCIYGNLLYECHVEKFNYFDKKFEICSFKGKKDEVERHFNKCGFIEYKCLFCKTNILNINLKFHAEKECKVRIMNHPSGSRYEGQVKNGFAEGYGKYYFSDGENYKGEWKNDRRNGFGINYYSNNDRYEGEFNDNKREGYGIYYSNGDRYEGEWKNDKEDGYGINNWFNGNKYEGQFKRGLLEGYGIYYYSNGVKYEGQFKNNKIEGYGIMFYLNGDKFQGKFKDDLREGFE